MPITFNDGLWAELYPTKKFRRSRSDHLSLERILETVEYAELGYIVKVVMQIANAVEERTKIFQLSPGNKKTNVDHFTDYMISILPKNYRPHAKVVSYWSDKFGHLIH